MRRSKAVEEMSQLLGEREGERERGRGRERVCLTTGMVAMLKRK